jgi:serine O-acetyltransferase
MGQNGLWARLETHVSLKPLSLSDYVARQLDNICPCAQGTSQLDADIMAAATQKTQACLTQLKNFNTPNFDYFNSGHYATFLYYASHLFYKNENTQLATRLFLLNKAINGIDLYYEIEMPDIFGIGHTVGMVFSKASYSNYGVFHQGCTIGRNQDDRPILEEGVILYPQSSVIGKCRVRKNTVIAPGVQLVNTDTPGNCIVFTGERGKPIFKEITENYALRYFKSCP